MASARSSTILITGANRGIGKELLKNYLSRSGSTVIAAVREPSNASAKALSELPVGPDTQLIIVKIDSTSETDPQDAVAALQRAKVTHVDTIIANAGIGTYYGPIIGATAAQIQEHVNINGIGPFLLFKAFHSLLEKSSQPKFVLIGSPNGSIGGMENYKDYPTFAYGASKSLAHFLIRKIHFEHENITSFSIDPGFTQTDMGNNGAKFLGMVEAPVPVKKSTEFILTQIDGATREKTSGHFPSISGGEVVW